MASGPLVTLAVITYNRRASLIASMERLRAQTYAPLDWLVVDGGSTDGTAEWLRDHADAYGFRYVSERDKGEYDAINKAIGLAKGEYLKVFSDDDLLYPDAIERYVAFAATRPDADIIFARARAWQLLPGNEKADLGLSPMCDPQRFTTRAMVRHDAQVNSMTAFMRRTVFDKVGLFRTDMIGGDWEYWVRAAHAGLVFAQLDHLTVDYQFTLDNGVSRRAFRIAVEGLQLARQYGTPGDVALMTWRFRHALLGLTQATTEVARFFHSRGWRPKKWLREHLGRG